ncbi:jg22006, partial [Pararge aegeria aegeria]
DRKGGETPLHLAVNSANCELDMVLIYFSVDRRDWFSLAHAENLSKKTPLEYAKNGLRSRPTTYPREIFEFLEKCRKTTRN